MDRSANGDQHLLEGHTSSGEGAAQQGKGDAAPTDLPLHTEEGTDAATFGVVEIEGQRSGRAEVTPLGPATSLREHLRDTGTSGPGQHNWIQTRRAVSA